MICSIFVRVNFFDLHKEARWDKILSTQIFLRGRERILSTQRFSGGRDRILSTQSGVPGSASTRSGVTRRHWGVRSDRCSCAERGRCGPGGTARLLGRDRILSIQRFSGGRDRILSTQRILKKNQWIYLKIFRAARADLLGMSQEKLMICWIVLGRCDRKWPK